jgi:acetate kinase
VDAVLVVNAGSTSLKLSAVAIDGSAEPVGSLDTAPAGVAAVAHRVVHGGTSFRDPVRIDDRVAEEVAALTALAPLHNGPAVAAIADARRALPDVPHVAVFDTAFHATLPEEAAVYAVPRRWRDEWGIRRFGFHGLSVEWAAERVAVSRLVVCHLGGGCSVTAVLDGRSAETTMGFSPLEGVPMATRSGSLDVEAVLHLLRTGRLDLAGAEHALEHESGLLGLSGLSPHVDELERSPEPAARLALAAYCHRIAGAVAASAVALGGLDALVFTAGVGEGSSLVRRDVCRRLGFLGVDLDIDANGAAEPDADVATPGSAVRIVVLRAREDVVAARAARALLGLPAQRSLDPFRFGRSCIEPAPDDPIAAAEGALAKEFGGLDLAELRDAAREAERNAQERRRRR